MKSVPYSFSINAYQRVAGEAIFEIGRRLKHVKENDLAHGEFGKWCESIGIDRSNANKFIRVFDELDVVTLPRLGLVALYQIALMPEAERTQPQTIPSTGEVKAVTEMTVRELARAYLLLVSEKESRTLSTQTRVRPRIYVVDEFDADKCWPVPTIMIAVQKGRRRHIYINRST